MNNMYYLNSKKDNKGFTLIEITVSLAVFATTAVVAVGAFLSILAANKKAQAAKVVINNLSYALESISREVRVGSNYYCGSDNLKYNPFSVKATSSCLNYAANSKSVLSFKTGKKDDSGNDLYYVYYFNIVDHTLYKSDLLTSVHSLNWSTDGDYYPVTSPSAIIKDFNFVVSNDTSYPKVQIFMSGVAGTKVNLQTDFKVQTTITQRI